MQKEFSNADANYNNIYNEHQNGLFDNGDDDDDAIGNNNIKKVPRNSGNQV